MINCPDYHYATNAAYQILKKATLRYGVLLPPVNIAADLFQDAINVRLLTYEQACIKYQCSLSTWLNVSSHGFTITEKTNNSFRYIVLYNEQKDAETIRFTLAHELAHIVLKHPEDNDVANKEANCFARNILCPIYMKHILRLESPYDYCDIFSVSEPMACASLDNACSDAFHIERPLYQWLYESFETHAHEFRLSS